MAWKASLSMRRSIVAIREMMAGRLTCICIVKQPQQFEWLAKEKMVELHLARTRGSKQEAPTILYVE